MVLEIPKGNEFLMRIWADIVEVENFQDHDLKPEKRRFHFGTPIL